MWSATARNCPCRRQPSHRCDGNRLLIAKILSEKKLWALPASNVTSSPLIIPLARVIVERSYGRSIVRLVVGNHEKYFRLHGQRVVYVSDAVIVGIERAAGRGTGRDRPRPHDVVSGTAQRGIRGQRHAADGVSALQARRRKRCRAQIAVAVRLRLWVRGDRETVRNTRGRRWLGQNAIGKPSPAWPQAFIRTVTVFRFPTFFVSEFACCVTRLQRHVVIANYPNEMLRQAV